MEDVKVKDEPGLESGSAAFARGGEASTSGMEEDGDSIVREIDVFVKPQLDGSTQVRLTRNFIVMENLLSHAQDQRAGLKRNIMIQPIKSLKLQNYHQKIDWECSLITRRNFLSGFVFALMKTSGCFLLSRAFCYSHPDKSVWSKESKIIVYSYGVSKENLECTQPPPGIVCTKI